MADENKEKRPPDRMARWGKGWGAIYPIASFTVATFFFGAITFAHLGQQQPEWWGVVFGLYGFVPISYWGAARRKDPHD